MFPSGALATPEIVLEQFPAIMAFPHIIETDAAEQMLWAVENLAAMRGIYNIDPSLTDDEAIKVLEELRNAPLPEAEITPEERIAAALEFGNLLSL